MISLATARKLQEAGITWQPHEGDLFALPDRGLDEKVFVISDMAAIIERVQGEQAVTFHGTPEWALDYLYVGETVWLPHESQLRDLLQQRLAGQENPVYDLLYADGRYICRFEWQGKACSFAADDAAEAYAGALLITLA